MKRNISFNESFPKYEKRKKDPDSEEDEDEDDSIEKMENREFKKNYKNQFNENGKYLARQSNAASKLMSIKDWEELDSESGPKGTYTGAIELQEGPELEANLNALENRGDEYTPRINKKTGEDISKKGVWGGKTRKGKKEKKTKKVRKSKKGKKGKKVKKSRKMRKSRK
jgi:hypothetical protein